MPAAKQAVKQGTRGEPEKTRAAILKAAMHEFASEGVAGARTDAIALAAGVNKALLYYYFKDKETLYGAALDSVFTGLREKLLSVLDGPLPSREKVLAYVGAHFDFIASAGPEYPRLVQHEMMRAGRSRSPHLQRIVKNYFHPVYSRLVTVLQEGVDGGDFRRVDVRHFIMSTIAIIVGYFNTLPVARLMLNEDPLSPERLAERRAAIIDFIQAALFQPGRGLSPKSEPNGVRR